MFKRTMNELWHHAMKDIHLVLAMGLAGYFVVVHMMGEMKLLPPTPGDEWNLKLERISWLLRL